MIRVANAPVSWGVLEFEGTDGRAGYSLVLDEIRETGYAGTELGDWGFLPTDPAELRSELGRRELALLGAFVPVALADPRSHAPGREAALRVARLMVQAAGDQPFIVLADDNGRVPLRMQNAGRIRPEHGLSDDSWQTFGEGAVRLAESVRRETGLRTVFHHHCAGYVETPGEMDRLLELTDPDQLGCAWIPDTTASGAGTRWRPCANTPAGSGMSTSRTASQPWRRVHVSWDGTTWSRSGGASSASWAEGRSISRECWPAWNRAATTAGSWWNRTSCPGWERPKTAPGAIGSTWPPSASDHSGRPAENRRGLRLPALPCGAIE